MLRVRATLGVIVLHCLLLIGCVQPHHTTAQAPQNAIPATNDVGSVAELAWQPGVGPNNDPPVDCASVPQAPKGSKSDGAVKGEMPHTAAYPIENVPVAKEYEIPADRLASFEGLVYYTVLPAGYPLYRVIGKGSNPVSGWWTGYLPPHVKAEWQSHLAVLAEWNGASCLVRYVAGTDGIKAWVGQASPQPDGVAGWYLKGGGWQVFVPEPDKQIKKDALQYRPISWAH